ncbi:MAG: AAA family ATPase, partial [Patescibacteria group bacterium]
MSSPTSKPLEFYFNEPRLKMTIVGRILVRIVSYVANLLFLVATLALVLSDLPVLRGLGILFLIFFLDRLAHLYEADRPLYEMPKEGRINLARYLTSAAYAIIERAYDRALLTRQNLFLEATRQLIGLREIRDGLRRLDIKPEEFRQKLDELLSESRLPNGERVNKDNLSAGLNALMLEAFSRAVADKQKFIEATDMFSSLARVSDPFLKRLFGTFSVEAEDMAHAMVFGSAKRRLARWLRLPRKLSAFLLGTERVRRHRIMNRAWTSRPTPTLDRYSLDLSDAARHHQVGFLVGHKAEYNRLVDTLSRPVNPNALLVGEQGIGKETIVAHLALNLTKDKVPAPLFDKRLVELRLANLVASAAPEELQQRVQTIAQEIITAGNVILYIPEIHNLVRTSGTAYLSAADGLMPILKDNAFPMIGATYPREHKQLIEPRSDFAGLFEKIMVEEISEDEAETILTYDALLLEDESKIFISFGAVKSAVKLAKKYLHNRFLPTSAEELLKSAIATAARRGDKFVGPEQVTSAAEEKVNVPIHEATRREAEELLNLEETIHWSLINQDEAVK